MYSYRPNLKRISLLIILFTQICLIAAYFYFQNSEVKAKLNSISFLTNNKIITTEKQTYHTLRDKINLKKITTREYFIDFNSSLCFTGGTDIKTMRVSKELNWQCNCFPGWHGTDCGYPEVLLRALLAYRKPVKLKGPRTFQRRLIYIFKFNKFSEHLADIRINELGDIIDLFVLYENNHNELENKLGNKFCKEYQHKILSIHKSNEKNLWKLVESHISNLRGDDVVLTSSVSEIPNRDALIFLKFYDNFPEPIHFRSRWSVYGFFWIHPKKTIISGGACTVAYLQNILNSDLNLLSIYHSNKTSAHISQKGITLGDLNHTGGWFCEFCATSDDIVEYLANKSRNIVNWEKIGTSKIDHKFIENLIESGLYIDSKLELERGHRYSDNNFAPKYVLNNDWKFDFLLVNFYSQSDYYI